MSESDSKSLNVVIGGINIPVKVRESESQQIQNISTMVNTRLQEIQIRYPEKSLEESLAMTILSLLVQKETESLVLPDQDRILEGFDRVDELLDKILQ
ncbi:MAG TPA: cell division protein ZapA [Membranihabitans sp.]|nr:cell division protein ZapA [Membranihabitans sp.]